MGLLTELFVATESDARAYAASNGTGPLPALARVDLGDRTNVEFETLWAILESEPWDVHQHALREVSKASETESWLFEFPERYVGTLKDLPPPKIGSASAAWAATDEMSTTPQVVLPIIEQLASLARMVGTRECRLFLWVSL